MHCIPRQLHWRWWLEPTNCTQPHKDISNRRVTAPMRESTHTTQHNLRAAVHSRDRLRLCATQTTRPEALNHHTAGYSSELQHADTDISGWLNSRCTRRRGMLASNTHHS
jgi:hypothetical protein